MAASRAVQVVVADDHPIYRDGLVAALCEDGLEVVAVCSRGDDVIDAIVEHVPAVAVIDQRMPGADALGVIATLAARGCPTRILVLSAFAGGDIVIRTLEAGASGYLAKESRGAICEAIRAVAAGETVIGSDLQGEVVEQIRQRAGADRPWLTAREIEILGLLAEGLSTVQIAQRLVIGQATVKTHLHHLYEKLDVSDRAAAVARAMRQGLLR